MNIPYTAIEINLQAERLRVLRSNILQVTRMYNKVCSIRTGPAEYPVQKQLLMMICSC